MSRQRRMRATPRSYSAIDLFEPTSPDSTPPDDLLELGEEVLERALGWTLVCGHARKPSPEAAEWQPTGRG
jgi:hypothetical protein